MLFTATTALYPEEKQVLDMEKSQILQRH